MNTAFNPFPSLPFGKERQRPGQWSPGPMWNGPDPTKTNLGIPTRSAVLTWDNPFGVLMDPALVPSSGGGAAPAATSGPFGMGSPSSSKIDAHIPSRDRSAAGTGVGSDPMSSDATGHYDRAPTPDPNEPKLTAYASGGTVRGPGGPTDDKVPAVVGNPYDPNAMPVRLSNGEEVTDALTRDVFGKKFFIDLKKKARKILAEADADERTERRGKADMREDAREGEHDDAPGYAGGGTVSTFSNPYADDPTLYAQKQQEARDAELAKDGVRDLGRGNIVLANPYGTGYGTQTATPQTKGRFEVDGGTATVTPGKGVKKVPDVVPAGNPWAAETLPFDRSAVRADIAAQTQHLEQGADLLRSADLMDGVTQAALTPKGRREITVPNANPFPTGTPTSRLMSMSEQDAARIAAKPSGAERKLARQWAQIPGTSYVSGPKGQTVPMAKGERPALTPEDAAAMGLQVKSVDSKGNPTYAPKSEAKNTNRVHSSKEVDGVLYNVMTDGTMQRATIEDPSPQMKLKAFKNAYQREPKNAQDWSEAYYLASGKSRPSAPSAAPAAPAAATSGKPFVMTASTTREHLAALPSGTPIRMPDGSIKYKR